MEYYSLRMMTPFGDITLFEHDNALSAIEWGHGPVGQTSPLLDETKAQLSAYFSGKLKKFDLPLDPMGTPFQKKVWQHLSNIAYGDVQTYGEVAKEIGSAARAIGGACGKNPIPLIIPCHRVVGQKNKLTGYTGGDGLQTKERLLALEQTISQL